METSVEIKDNNIAVTRDGCVYLYKLLNGKYQMYSLSPDITREFSEYWDSNLLAKRDGSWNWFVEIGKMFLDGSSTIKISAFFYLCFIPWQVGFFYKLLKRNAIFFCC